MDITLNPVTQAPFTRTEPPMNPDAPGPETQRAMIAERVQMYREAGFEAFLEAEAARVQTATAEPEKKALAERIRTLEAKAANCYASAARLQELLGGVPDAPEAPAG